MVTSRKLPGVMKHRTHDNHDHVHGPGCGHTAIQHGDHTDYLHDGHLHRKHHDHVDECEIAVDAAHPAACTKGNACGHVHGPSCGHESVPHGDHVDFLVDGHLHHPHDGHCDDHGSV